MPDIILLLGIAILTGYLAGEICEKINQPKVVGWILGGVVLGMSGFRLFDLELLDLLDPINFLVLTLIGFDIGRELSYEMLSRLGKSVLTIAFFATLICFIIVTLGITFFTGKLWIGLIFGALSVATAPATVVEVLREYNASGPLTSTIFAVVAIDDAIGVIYFAIAISYAKILFVGGTLSLIEILIGPMREIFGALVLGVVLGVVFARATEFVHDMRELLLLSFGTILFSCGLAEYFGLSYILVSMVLGMTVINLPFGDKRCFDVLDKAKPPLYILFFLFAGARVQINLLAKIGMIGFLYILFRSIGKTVGPWTASHISGASGFVRNESRMKVEKYFWLCMLTQAGVAIGLSIEAMRIFAGYGPAGEQFGAMLITIIAGTSLFFEVVGPPFVKLAIFKAGEAGKVLSKES
ncbi:MAG: cation:proton antiporter [Candidatus Hydrothermarchaeales archaeon]